MTTDTGLRVQDPELLEWVWRRIGSRPPSMVCIGWRDTNGEPVGGFIFERYTGRGGSVRMHYAGRPHWLTARRLRQVAEYVFVHLDCSVAYGEVDAGDAKVRRIDERLGWELVVVLKGALAGGRDMALYEMRRENCRWLHHG